MTKNQLKIVSELTKIYKPFYLHFQHSTGNYAIRFKDESLGFPIIVEKQGNIQKDGTRSNTHNWIIC